MKGTPDIKIITGIRRCGKSCLLQAFIKHIKETEESANIIFIDFTRLEFEPVREYHALHQYVQDHYRANVSNYLMIDEVFLLQGVRRHATRAYHSKPSSKPTRKNSRVPALGNTATATQSYISATTESTKGCPILERPFF